jgi:hypothetical protein
MAATPDQMLQALHAADKSSLNKRYSPQELQKAYQALQAKKGGGGAGAGGNPAANQPTNGQVGTNTTTSNPVGVFNNTVNSNQGQANWNNQHVNPTVNNPFVNSTVTYDANGNPTVNSQLGGYGGAANAFAQSLLGSNGGTGFSQATGAGQFGSDPMGQYQGSVYNSLTRGLDQRKAQAQQDFEQNLANRGIGVGSGAAYDNATKDFNQSWDDQYSNAQSQAIQQGSQMFNSTAANLGNIAAQAYGAGNFNYQFQGAQPTSYADVLAQQKAANAAQTTANANASLAGRRYRGSPAGGQSAGSPIFGGNAF